jgi:AcrR family transcriptional regulator
MSPAFIFADHGPGAPLEEIAQRAGVGIGTLYRRFPNRQSLLRAVALDVLARVAQEARLALAGGAAVRTRSNDYLHIGMVLFTTLALVVHARMPSTP